MPSQPLLCEELRDFRVRWMPAWLLFRGRADVRGITGGFFARVRAHVQPGRQGWELCGTPEPGTLSALTGTQGRAQGTLGHSSGGLQWSGTALGTRLVLLREVQPLRGGIAVGVMGSVVTWVVVLLVFSPGRVIPCLGFPQQ